MSKNIIMRADSYKHSHYFVYPEGLTKTYAYLESRKGTYPYNIFFGMQAYLKKYLLDPFTLDDILIAEERIHRHMPQLQFNRKGWEYIYHEYGGWLPLKIRSVVEGSQIPIKNVMVTAESTDPKVPWVTGHIDTTLLRGIWYPTTVATRSHNIRQIIKEALLQTTDLEHPEVALNFMLHDFGMRGNTSEESAGISGAAHLVNFMGTDTTDALDWVDEYYHMRTPGFSIPATEHSNMTIYGRKNEIEAYRAAIRAFGKPGAIFSTVVDSYNIYDVCRYLLPRLRDELIASESILVIRPDSGDPAEVLPKILGSLEHVFGTVVNAKGYKRLNNIKLIWGDGINEQSITIMLDILKNLGFAVEIMAFGCGGYLVQDLTRDTQGFAMKTSAAMINGVWVDIQKDPSTDQSKKSKAGRVTLYKNSEGTYHTSLLTSEESDELQTVYHNGQLMNSTSFQDIRTNAGMWR